MIRAKNCSGTTGEGEIQMPCIIVLSLVSMMRVILPRKEEKVCWNESNGFNFFIVSPKS